MRKIPVSAILLAAVCLPCAAQTVYESKDKSGATVFSDRPTPGAKAVELAPPNLSVGVKPQPPGPAPAAAPPYASLAISSPANEDTIHSNTGAFSIRVRNTPALRTAAGDRIRVKLDGTLLASSYSSGQVSIRAADWQAAAADNAQHTLQAAIIDRSGATLIESAPVRFYVKRATASGARR